MHIFKIHSTRLQSNRIIASHTCPALINCSPAVEYFYQGVDYHKSRIDPLTLITPSSANSPRFLLPSRIPLIISVPPSLISTLLPYVSAYLRIHPTALGLEYTAIAYIYIYSSGASDNSKELRGIRCSATSFRIVRPPS